MSYYGSKLFSELADHLNIPIDQVWQLKIIIAKHPAKNKFIIISFKFNLLIAQNFGVLIGTNHAILSQAMRR